MTLRPDNLTGAQSKDPEDVSCARPFQGILLNTGGRTCQSKSLP
jgi:hypothetical protein